MTKRRLRLYDPRVRVKADTGIRVSRPTLAMIEEARSWLLAQLWETPELRPEGWNGKLSQDETLRIILNGFSGAYGVPLNTAERFPPCSDDNTPPSPA